MSNKRPERRAVKRQTPAQQDGRDFLLFDTDLSKLAQAYRDSFELRIHGDSVRPSEPELHSTLSSVTRRALHSQKTK